ncbi:MAG: hypothetical protein NTV40_09825 [Solirubrobacterales bacterium]|nr:hypothetical protein [Solirubrobacterales bacterium]
MGRKQRRQQRIAAPTSDYSSAEGDTLTLRGSMSPATRQEYAAVRTGEHAAPAAVREDVWQRAREFLFERLAVRWTIAGMMIDNQKQLLARYRMASASERDWIHGVMREHCGEHFPDLESP